MKSLMDLKQFILPSSLNYVATLFCFINRFRQNGFQSFLIYLWKFWENWF